MNTRHLSAGNDPAEPAVTGAARQLRLQLFRELLARCGSARLRVWGSSMLPSIWPGELLEIVRVDPRALRAGDVVLFQRGSRLFCHRVQALETDGATPIRLRTRGDFLDRDDPWVPVTAVLGRVQLPSRRRRDWPFLWRALNAISLRPLSWILRTAGIDPR